MKLWRQLFAALAVLALPLAAPAQSVFNDEWSGYSWTLTTGFFPGFGAIDMAFLPDGRIYVAKKMGTVGIYTQNGTWNATVLDWQDRVNNTGDSGLQAIATDPNFETTPWLYLFYTVETDTGNPDNTQSRYGRLTRVLMDESTNYTSMVAGSEEILIGETWSEGIMAEGPFHVGGGIRFGDDKTLLMTTGDSHFTVTYLPSGSDAFLPGRFPASMDIGPLRAQALDNLSGKVLRIDKDTGLGLPSNPFYTGNPDDAQSKVFAYGLRMPWRFDVLRGTGSHTPSDGRPGSVWVGDVGWDSYDDLNISARTGGDNFGWPFYEGHLPIDDPLYDEGTYAGPIPYVQFEDTSIAASWGHHSGDFQSWPPEILGDWRANSLTGGVFYDFTEFGHERSGRAALNEMQPPPNVRNQNFRHNAGKAKLPRGGLRHDHPYTPVIEGKYIFADWALHNLYAATLDEFENLVDIEQIATGDINAAPDEGIVDLDYNPATGELWALTYWRMYRLDYDPSGGAPIAVVEADKVDGDLPLEVTLDGSDTVNLSGGALTYNWIIDGAAPIVTTEPTYTHLFTEDRNYNVDLYVVAANSKASTDSITIFAGNQPPVANIVNPKPWHKYPADGSTGIMRFEGEVSDPDGGTAPDFYWKVALGHDMHRHDIELLDTLSGTYELTASDDENTWYIFELFATDERGQTVYSSVNVYEYGEGPAPPFVAAEKTWNYLE